MGDLVEVLDPTSALASAGGFWERCRFMLRVVGPYSGLGGAQGFFWTPAGMERGLGRGRVFFWTAFGMLTSVGCIWKILVVDGADAFSGGFRAAQVLKGDASLRKNNNRD